MPPDLDRRRDLGRILDDGFALYRAHWRTLVAIAATVVIPVQLAVLGIGGGWLWSHYDGSPPLGDTVAGVMAQLMVIGPLVTAMTVDVVLTAGQGQRPSARRAIVTGLDAFAPLFWAVLLAVIGVVAGIFALILPGLWLAVRWSVVPQAVVVEGERGAAALRRSASLVRGHWWWTFAVLVVVDLVVSFVSAAITVPVEYLAKAADAQAVDLFATIAGQVLTLPLVGLALTLVYFTLRADPELADARAIRPDRPVEPVGDQAWEQRRREGWEPPV